MSIFIRRFVACSVATVLLALLVPGSARAQIPDEFTNLQVLPDDIGKRELIGVMREFAGALGVRCNYCHGDGDTDSLEGVDFASDENAHKTAARGMMTMVLEINSTLLPAAGRTDPIEVRCVTCHRGVDEPETLDRIILEVSEKDGVPAAMDRYRELRDEHYGRGAYDFGPGTLNQVVEALAAREDLDGAIAGMMLNVEFNPDAAYSHLVLGQLQAMKGNTDEAIASIERAIDLEPDNRRAKQMLEQVKSGE